MTLTEKYDAGTITPRVYVERVWPCLIETYGQIKIYDDPDSQLNNSGLENKK